MKKSHAGLWIGITVFFLAAVYSVILFLLKSHFDIAAWELYGATMIAFLLVGIQAIASVRTLTPVIVCEIIILATYLVFAFVMYAAQSNNAAQDHNDQKTVQKMRLLESDVQGMMEESSDSDVKKALRELAEAIHYSDVVSLPGLADVEGRIAQNIAILQDELTDDAADPLARIETLRRLLKERDRTAAILKR